MRPEMRTVRFVSIDLETLSREHQSSRTPLTRTGGLQNLLTAALCCAPLEGRRFLDLTKGTLRFTGSNAVTPWRPHSHSFVALQQTAKRSQRLKRFASTSSTDNGFRCQYDHKEDDTAARPGSSFSIVREVRL